MASDQYEAVEWSKTEWEWLQELFSKKQCNKTHVSVINTNCKLYQTNKSYQDYQLTDNQSFWFSMKQFKDQKLNENDCWSLLFNCWIVYFRLNSLKIRKVRISKKFSGHVFKRSKLTLKNIISKFSTNAFCEKLLKVKFQNGISSRQWKFEEIIFDSALCILITAT